LVFLNLKISSFGNTFLSIFTLFIVYKLNDSYFTYKNGSTFQKKHVGYDLEEIGVFKFENFHLLVTLFEFFLPF